MGAAVRVSRNRPMPRRRFQALRPVTSRRSCCNQLGAGSSAPHACTHTHAHTRTHTHSRAPRAHVVRMHVAVRCASRVEKAGRHRRVRVQTLRLRSCWRTGCRPLVLSAPCARPFGPLASPSLPASAYSCAMHEHAHGLAVCRSLSGWAAVRSAWRCTVGDQVVSQCPARCRRAL